MIRCPNCQHKIEVKGAKPGRYTPQCPACHHRFEVMVSADATLPPHVAKLPPVAETIAPATHAARPAEAQATVPPPMAPSRVAATVSPSPVEQAIEKLSGPKVDRTKFQTQSLGGEQLAYDDLTTDLAGYDILKKLGQGGMGSVYLARQISLDRNVALKTLSPTLAMDPQFVARFTREAYAAAQLTHHNIVQIHDIGQDRGTNFFSMELVEGDNLGQLVEREGRLDPMTAVSYVLQAARGLKFAHQRGLIHRDVKPDNLLINSDGIVKVADLGLVKRLGAAEERTLARNSKLAHASQQQTQFNTSMGTPAYMAPEQTRDASKVDHRADIYSLGCTLYDLITGRPPFSGNSAIEVMTKHQREPITPPEKIVTNLPKRLSEIVQRMTAKNPDSRYQTMDEVTRDLEDFLGVEHGGASRASQENVRVITEAAEKFNAASFARHRVRVIAAFYLLCAIVAAVGVLWLSFATVAGAIGFAVVATLAYQCIVGVARRTPVFLKTRQWLLGASFGDWLTTLAGLAVLVAIVFLLKLLVVAVLVGVAAVVAALLFHLAIDHIVTLEREEPLKQADGVIRAMRAAGTDEDGIRGFVAKFSGHTWEAFYEALFGYDAKIEARRVYGKGERGRDRKRQGIWRDWYLAWVDRHVEARKQARERALLAKLEQKALEARGEQPNIAARQARQAAAAMVERASELRSREAETFAVAPAAQQTVVYVRPSWIDDEKPAVSDHLEDYQKQSYLRRRFGGPLDILLGRRVRFLLAAVVLLGAARWVQINDVAAMFDEAKSIASAQARTAQDVAGGKITTAQEVANGAAPVRRSHEPLVVPMVPEVVTNAVGSWRGVAAGVLLLLSVPLYGHLMSLGVLAGCAITLFAPPVHLPALEALADVLPGAAGAAVALLSMLFLRRRED